MNDALIRLVLIGVAGITVASGLSQLVCPEFVLNVVGSDTSAPSQHLFRTVGMFMAITGAMFFQSLLARSREPAIPLWIGVQKLAAAGLVGWGYTLGLFGTLALGVAGFDLVSGVIAWLFLARLGK